MSASPQNSASEPLIQDGLEPSEGSRELHDDANVDESHLVTPTLFISVLTACAGISGLLFGYDTGVISSTLVSINADLSSRPLTTLDKSLITSCTSLFALLASPASGLLADHLGRKPVLLLADFLFVVGALWQAFTTTVPGMIAGRSIVGAAVGAASCVAPLYISELAPSPFRGRMVVVSALFITAGQVVAYLVGWGFSETEHGWRWMVGLGAAPAVVQCVLLWGWLPETPRWLVRAGKADVARRVLGRVYGGGGRGEENEELVVKVLRGVEREILSEEEEAVGVRGLPAEGKGGWRAGVRRVRDRFEQLVGVGGNRRALIIACFLQAFQQLSGFNSLMYFSATIFSLVGFRSPILTSLSIATSNFLFTLVAFYYIDRVGRRRILLYSIPVMIIGLAICAVAFSFLGLVPVEKEALGALENAGGAGAWAKILLAAMLVYVAGYAVGIGNVPWQQSELFPLPVRSLGSSLATSTNWATNFLIGITFLPLMESLSPTGTFLLYALVCAAAWGVVWKIYPETVGLGLEDVGDLLREGWGVR